MTNKLLTIEQTDYLSWMPYVTYHPLERWQTMARSCEGREGDWGTCQNLSMSHITLYVRTFALHNYMTIVNETLVYQTVKAKKKKKHIRFVGACQLSFLSNRYIWNLSNRYIWNFRKIIWEVPHILRALVQESYTRTYLSIFSSPLYSREIRP